MRVLPDDDSRKDFQHLFLTFVFLWHTLWFYMYIREEMMKSAALKHDRMPLINTFVKGTLSQHDQVVLFYVFSMFLVSNIWINN